MLQDIYTELWCTSDLNGEGKTVTIVSYLLPPPFFICVSNSGEISIESKHCHVICDISCQSSCVMRERSFRSTDV
jgi:hypothetical protein